MIREEQSPPKSSPQAEVYHQRIEVGFDYPVYFTRGVFDAVNPLLESAIDRLKENRRQRAGVFVDAGVAQAHRQLTRQVKEYFHAHPAVLELAGGVALVPGGEAAKTGWQGVRDVMTTIGNLHLDRQSCVLAVGGGAALDMVGFAASIVHRGLRTVRVPTTTLAQNDAGIGVKTGMDEHGQKNFVGTFAPPFAVLNDFAFLPTLADRDWIGGAAEAFKVAIIKDADFFDYLCRHAPDLRRRNQPIMEQVIRRCAVLHLDHIRDSGDAFEFGSARPLDFGHWAGHKLETLSGYAVGHGQAVAVGIALDCYYAMRTGLLSEPDLMRILGGLTGCGLPVWCAHLNRRNGGGALAILDGLNQFREHLGGALTITLPAGLGRTCEVHQVNPLLVEEAARFLKTFPRPVHEDPERPAPASDVLPERPPR